MEPSPITGVVTFTDDDGFDRTLNFIDTPRGLDAEDVRETAVQLELDAPPTEPVEASFWIMHPERCMESRIPSAASQCKADSATKPRPGAGFPAFGVRLGSAPFGCAPGSEAVIGGFTGQGSGQRRKLAAYGGAVAGFSAKTRSKS
jgi:hypothetical protein